MMPTLLGVGFVCLLGIFCWVYYTRIILPLEKQCQSDEC